MYFPASSHHISDRTFFLISSFATFVVLLSLTTLVVTWLGNRCLINACSDLSWTFQPSLRVFGAIPFMTPCRNHLRTLSLCVVILLDFNISNASSTLNVFIFAPHLCNNCFIDYVIQHLLLQNKTVVVLETEGADKIYARTFFDIIKTLPFFKSIAQIIPLFFKKYITSLSIKLLQSDDLILKLIDRKIVV